MYSFVTNIYGLIMIKDLNNICSDVVFEKLFHKHAKDLRRFLFFKTKDIDLAEDILQDAFIKLWDNCKKVTMSTAKSYLFKVANNMMLNEIKHQKVVLRHQQSQPNESSNETPEFLLEQEQFYENYKKALSKLSEDQRAAFLLNKAEGKKHIEIAELLGVTKKVVEYRIYTAFKILKEELEGFNLK